MTDEQMQVFIEMMFKIERYEKALREIKDKGGYKIRGQVANELSEIAGKALKGFDE
jgi:hypothetical protein